MDPRLRRGASLTGVDREEEAPPSKSPRVEDHDSPTRAERAKPLTSDAAGRGHGPGPAPSCQSEEHQRRSRIHQEKPEESEHNCQSLKSDWSMERIIDLRGAQERQRS
ncbi:uncharacterized protein ACB058_013062 isoform 2-T2 [Synchiropus picturatus]